MVINPLCSPGTSDAVLTLAVTVEGVVPEAGVALSQLTPEAVLTAVAKLTGSLVLPTLRDCGRGAGLPNS
jgi:hypothetical protein